MSLQRRLTLFFVLIVILPLGVAGFVVQRVVVSEISRRALQALDPSLDATLALYNDRSEALPDRVRSTLELAQFTDVLEKGRRAEVDAFLEGKLASTNNVDFFLAFDPEGRPLGEAMTPGEFLEGVKVPSPQQILAAEGGAGPGFLRTAEIPVRVRGSAPVGRVIGGMWIDRELLSGSSQDAVVLSLVADGRLIASTAALAAPTTITPSFDGDFEADIGGDAKASARPLPGGMALISSTPTAPMRALSRRVLTSMLSLLALAMIGTTVLAYVLARLITQPLEDLAAGAKDIAEGRFDVHIPARSNDEVGQLAVAFNDMSSRLKETITELSTSRDQLQRAVRRVGQTLRATHDMSQMLESILNTAIDAVQGDAGALWRFTPTREDLYASTVTGLNEADLDLVRVGDGVVGLVAERATNILLPNADGAPTSAPGEPDAGAAIVIPLYSQNRVMGVLAVYRDEARPFTEENLDTVVFLGEQGGVAIENVQLHEEARRHSLMDGLTGVWNRRFFQMQFRQVLATATRFDRPFSVLMLDLDFFKQINDTYGHTRGDAILIEFAQRVSGTLREVDTFARYGGEEFICLLSETDLRGALTTAEKICDVIRSEPFGGLGEEPISLSVSIGVSAYPDHGDNFKVLVEAADRALYRAKEGGRDRVEVADNPSSQLKLAT